MKLVGIGDLFIPKQFIETGFASFRERGCSVEVLDWPLKNFQELQEINLLVENRGSDAVDPPEEILRVVEDADIIITQFFPIGSKILEACGKLKAIGVLRSGVENVDVAGAAERGIVVFNTPGRNADAVADFTVGVLIAECRNIARGHHGLKSGRWIREYPNSGIIPDLPGKAAGIIGLGEIGRKVARRLAGFDMNLLGYDPFVAEAPENIRIVSLEELMAESDFVTIHARLTGDTEGMIGAELLSRMKPTSYLINTSRSAIVDEKALFETLRDGRIAGAALDVFDTEPPGADYPLVMLDNVTLTPHMAGGSNDAFVKSPIRLAAQMESLWTKEPSRFMLNPDVFEAAVQWFG